MIDVSSEIGRLKTVLLHRPGRELERLTPKYLEAMLFEDIPWLKKIRQEHDQFAQTLRNEGCEVLYYEEMLSEILEQRDVRARMSDEVIATSRLGSEELKESIRHYLDTMDLSRLSEVFISGLQKSEIEAVTGPQRLSSYIKEAYPFYIDPLTNLYFTRDPGAVILSGLSVHAMKTPARRRETLILKYLRDYHPVFKSSPFGAVSHWYDPEDLDSIEGGDILVLSRDCIALGCSSRTGAEAIERIASRLFAAENGPREILVVQIPFTRAFMHLDTVLTMLDRDTFVIYPGIKSKLSLFRLRPGREGGLSIEPLDSLEQSLKDALKLPALRLIESGGGDVTTAAREQWNDSTNTLALAPGRVVTYDRNVASNDTLRNAGIEVVEIEGSELVRGRGGPRCMSMPLLRESLDS